MTYSKVILHCPHSRQSWWNNLVMIIMPTVSLLLAIKKKSLAPSRICLKLTTKVKNVSEKTFSMLFCQNVNTLVVFIYLPLDVEAACKGQKTCQYWYHYQASDSLSISWPIASFLCFRQRKNKRPRKRRRRNSASLINDGFVFSSMAQTWHHHIQIWHVYMQEEIKNY